MEGNQVKMRDALVEISKFADDWSLYANTKAGALDRIYELANAALAAPPRQCDVGTPNEQAERFAKHCDRFYRCIGCPCCGKIKYNRCEFIWAQTPYEAQEGAGE